MEWEFPSSRPFLEGMAEFARVILHDHRGVGVSSRNVPIPNLETRVADLVTVLDTIGSERPMVLGVFASGAVNALLAATRPERVGGLIWIDPAPRSAWAPDFPWGRTSEQLADELEELRLWGTSAYGREFVAREAASGNVLPEGDADVFSRASRNACTPDVANDLERMWYATDVRAIAPAISVPTLFICHVERGEVDFARSFVGLIPGAQLREIPGTPYTLPTVARVIDEVRRFVGIERPPVELDTVLGTVLFTDIVRSTEMQESLGDRGWKRLVEQHHAIVRGALDRWQGVENDTAGDGFYATFDGPARAIRCASDVVARVRDLGVEVRAGLHTGECEVIDGKLGGIAVSIGARVAAFAGPSQILVTQTVKDLVAGSRLSFTPVGERDLRGVSGARLLYAVSEDR
jgi:class 3 adenylate cyclase